MLMAFVLSGKVFIEKDCEQTYSNAGSSDISVLQSLFCNSISLHINVDNFSSLIISLFI